jgi:type IX secretion system PorP/SprF family membrane protein
MSFDLNREWNLKPSAFIKFSDNISKSVQADITARLFYKEDYWGGLSYRSQEALSIMIGYLYDRKIYIGYSYDLVLNPLGAHNFGSHELMLGYRFNDIKD